MRKALLILVFEVISITLLSAQNCPLIDFRNNGNGQPNSCPNVGSTPMASNFVGTSYATAFNGMSKTGNIRFVFDGNVTAPPAINKIWIGTTLSTVVAGPASVPSYSSGKTTVTYCFYNSNLPAAGFYTIEYVNPITNAIWKICGYDGNSGAIANPPIITSQPQNVSGCFTGDYTFSVTASPSYGGTLSYQWKKNGVNIAGATSSTHTITNASTLDIANYSCLIGESNGTFTESISGTISLIVCNYLLNAPTSTITNTTGSSWNSAWVDYDNDGWEDLYILDKDNTKPNQLYKNNGNKTFTKVTNTPLTSFNAKSITSLWGDIDNDGDKDVLVINATEMKNRFFRNDVGVFTELTNTGINDQPDYNHGGVFADFDNDGYLDLLLTNFFATKFHQIYKNNGNNTFTKKLTNNIASETERSMAPVLCDYNHDRLIDIFIPNGNDRPNSLFKNLGNFQFEKINADAIGIDAFNSVGATWGDYDNDGWEDLFVANASGQNNNLYKNNGNGTFTKVVAGMLSGDGNAITQDGGHNHGCNWIDLENDGDLDLYVTNDSGSNFLYVNNGSNSFTKILNDNITADLGNCFGMAWADSDKDGMEDVLLSRDENQTNLFFYGKNNNNSWINIKLQGTISNKDGIGASIKVKSNNTWQRKQQTPVSGFGGQNSMRQKFGLNNATIIQEIVVEWPSGITQTISNINVNQFITIIEETGQPIYGYTFDDTNNNCIKDTNESIIPDITFKIVQNGMTCTTNDQGYFNINVPNGTYTLEVQNSEYWEGVCTVNANAGSGNTVYIPLKAIIQEPDLEINYVATLWRRGFDSESIIQVNNNGTTANHNAIVNLNYPSKISLISANMAFTNNGNGNYSFDLGSIQPNETKYIRLIDNISLTASIGEELSVSTNVTGNITESKTDNNTNVFSMSLVGAIDPNDIAVTPTGDGAEGYVLKDQELTYKIRFENIGNYQATFINVENTIPEGLNLETFKIKEASHDYRYTLSSKGHLKITFDNINLPPKIDDEVGCHGFISYTIMPKKTNKEFCNKALIFFDYEDPIETNTVCNKIKEEINLNKCQLKIYPNPVYDNLHVELIQDTNLYEKPTSIISIILRDGLGKKIFEQFNYEQNQLIELDFSNLDRGFYFIESIDSQNNIEVKKIIKY
jgi:uncharacterized repeat protein (TIGR01451 family)